MAAPLIIIGTGMAGYSLAKEFRKHNKERRMLLITEDDGSFYSKPMLSESFSKQKTADQLIRFTSEQMQSQLDADILTYTKVKGIDPVQKTISLAGRTLTFSDLILAVGANPKKHPLSDLFGSYLYYLNHLNDYRQLTQAIHKDSHVLIIGSGLIGTEIAHDLSSSGIQTTVLSHREGIMPNTLPSPISKELKKALESKGVSFCLNRQIKAIGENNKHLHITLDNNQELSVDVVLSAIGLEPDIQLAETANLKTRQAIVTDDFLQTSQNHIYALGDCAEVNGQNLMYILPLMNCVKALAKTLNGMPTPVNYPVMPVSVKTPSYPITFSPPSFRDNLSWQIDVDNKGIKATCYDRDNHLKGYFLTQEKVAEKKALNIQIK